MMRGSDSTTARSSIRPPMVAGPMLRNFMFLRTASFVGCARAMPVNRAMNRRVLADFMTVWGTFYHSEEIRAALGCTRQSHLMAGLVAGGFVAAHQEVGEAE